MHVEVLEYTPTERDTLRASLVVRLTAPAETAIELRNVQLRERDGRRWIMLPVVRSGASFCTVIKFPDPRQHEAFRDKCLLAMDRHLATQAQEVAA